MNKYRAIKALGDGAFGQVTLALNSQTEEMVAIKTMKRKFATWDECLKLKELRSLKALTHQNIVKLKEVIREEQVLYFVFEYCELNLFKFIRESQKLDTRITESQIRNIMQQLFSGIAYTHKHGFFHRDIKPENLLMTADLQVKLADFGLAREIRSRPPYTEYVATRWYRAPELLLKSSSYNSPVDMWACGCIMAELYNGKTLFPGTSEGDQIHKICQVLGTPTKQNWPEGLALATQMQFRLPLCTPMPMSQVVPSASYEAQILIRDLLQYDPSKRPTATQCFKYAFFSQAQAEEEEDRVMACEAKEKEKGEEGSVEANHESGREDKWYRRENKARGAQWTTADNGQERDRVAEPKIIVKRMSSFCKGEDDGERRGLITKRLSQAEEELVLGEEDKAPVLRSRSSSKALEPTLDEDKAEDEDLDEKMSRGSAPERDRGVPVSCYRHSTAMLAKKGQSESELLDSLLQEVTL